MKQNILKRLALAGLAITSAQDIIPDDWTDGQLLQMGGSFTDIDFLSSSQDPSDGKIG